MFKMIYSVKLTKFQLFLATQYLLLVIFTFFYNFLDRIQKIIFFCGTRLYNFVSNYLCYSFCLQIYSQVGEEACPKLHQWYSEYLNSAYSIFKCIVLFYLPEINEMKNNGSSSSGMTDQEKVLAASAYEAFLVNIHLSC